MAAARLTGIRLVMKDPAAIKPGVLLAWSYPEGANVTSFEIFQSFRSDSLGGSIAVLPRDSFSTLLDLPDTASPPYKLYFAVRALFVEPTGQKQRGDTLPIDSLAIAAPNLILQPALGSTLSDRILTAQVRASSTTGVTLRQLLFEKPGDAWIARIDTCLPKDDCRNPIIGTTTIEDALVLDAVPPGKTQPALFCVVGTENFEGGSTGLSQSMRCNTFTRTAP